MHNVDKSNNLEKFIQWLREMDHLALSEITDIIRHGYEDALKDPVNFALRLNSTEEQACDLWCRFASSNVKLHEFCGDGKILNLWLNDIEPPLDIIELRDKENRPVVGSIFSISIPFNKRWVLYLGFDGMDPRSSIFLEEEDLFTESILKSTSMNSAISLRKNIVPPYDNNWTFALSEKEHLSHARIGQIYEQYSYPDSRDKVEMIKRAQGHDWLDLGLTPAELRQKISVWDTLY